MPRNFWMFLISVSGLRTSKILNSSIILFIYFLGYLNF
jgi:hypothetical protein